MFIANDTTTEIIAHFLGYFEIAVDGMRQRMAYEAIEAEPEPLPEDPQLEQVAVDIAQKYSFTSYAPGVEYVPPSWAIRGEAAVEPLSAPAPVIVIAPDIFLPPLPSLQQPMGDMPPLPLIGPEPGSVIALFKQSIVLSDNDIVVLGQYDGPLVFQSGAGEGIVLMHAAAAEVSAPVTAMRELHSTDDVPLLVGQVVQVIGGLAGDEAPPDTTVEVVETIEGNYVNGAETEEIPDLQEALPEHLQDIVEDDDEETDETEVAAAQVTIAGDDAPDSVTLEAGGNLMVNEAAFFNAGLTGSIFAIDGDLHQLDAIIQTNAYCDTDTVDGAFPGAGQNAPGTTATYNAAAFIQEVRDATGEAAEAKPGVFPTNWQVSVVTGDVVFIEWLTQFSFMSDQDMSVLSSSGTSTLVTSGENVGLNGVSFVNIGLHFDLILIGGNLYDANIVVQTNVLYDNDTVELLADGSVGHGSLSTSGNLMWNQATIHNVGPTEFEEDMPHAFDEAMERIEDGDLSMPSAFATDGMFEGYSMLKVLYIEGSVYDLRYVEQTNVLGDADYVAAQQAQLLDAHPETEWDVSTGSNALVNIATIKDHDGLGNTAYVDGEVYSDAILIQADIIAAESEDESSEQLVTEVIAFLDVDIDSDVIPDAIGPTPPSADGPPADIIQSVLA